MCCGRMGKQLNKHEDFKIKCTLAVMPFMALGTVLCFVLILYSSVVPSQASFLFFFQPPKWLKCLIYASSNSANVTEL